MKRQLNFNRGFTLIELLVVVAIIALLASIVMASLSSARAKSKDSFLREEATQMRVLLEQQYNDTGSYIGLQPAVWITTLADCDSMSISGNYVAQTRAICKAIINNTSTLTWNGGAGYTKFYLGNGVDLSNKYSILISLPYKDTYLCVGSSGATSDTSIAANLWNQPGCYSNP